jgi:hypothetical protein
VPRRSRGHVYRKRTAPPTNARPRTEPAVEEAQPEVMSGDLEAAAPAAQAPAPYVRRQSSVSTARPAAAPPPRASRALVADYGYVVTELKRIGFTFGGLIVLLILLSRFLH